MNKNMIVICGKKRSGKDALADRIQDRLGYQRYALAEPIKLYLAMAAEELNMDIFLEDFYEGDREKDLGLDDYHVKMLFITALDKVYKRLGLEFKSEFCLVIDAVVNKHIMSNGIWSIRTLMQIFGTDIGVCLKKDIWLQFIPVGMHLIITDCRQQHEIDYCREQASMVIHLERPGLVSNDSHITERGITPLEGEAIIVNDGTLEDLYTKADALVGY